MDNSAKQEQNHDESNNAGNEKDQTKERIHSMSHSTSKQNKIRHSHPRSRSPNNIRSPKQWTSSNAFINFMHEFRQNFTGVRSTRIFQLAGERWRQMSPKEKQPYIQVAVGIRSRKVNQNEQVNKSNKNTGQNKNESPRRKQTRNTKKLERNSKKQKQSNKKKNTAESDTNSATSGTTGSKTSEDMSDASS